MRVVATLEHNGESRTYEYEVEEKYREDQHYLWTEGNYSCDCNRFIFFEDPPDDDGPDPPCGDGGYTLTSLTLDGEEVL